MKKLFSIIFLVIPAFLLGCNFDNNEKTFSEKTENEPVTSEKTENEPVTSEKTEKEPVTIEIKNQPVTTVVKKSTSVELKFEAEINGGNLTYQWYESADGTTGTGKAIANENQNIYTVSPFTERGLRYFYCVAETESETVTSSIAAIAYTELPLVEITTVNNEEPTAEQVSPPAGCYGAGLQNATKVPARMIISKNDETIYDSGEYEKKQSGLTIKLRGNTSAYSEKKPYKIKLQKKADLLKDLLSREEAEYKDKDWILLKDATSLNTFVGMTVADIAGTEWTPEFAFVNVIMNGSYRGTYLLIEAINKNEKRVNVADDGYIIERDAYWWNEDKKFITDLNQKYTFKYPDEDDITDEQIEYIKNYMNTVEENIQSGTYEDYIDYKSYARWQLIHDLLGTWDEGGSNIYISKYDSTDQSKLVMSTPWDFDSNYQMKNTWSRVHNVNRIYSALLFSNENTAFKDSYKEQYNAIKNSLWRDLSIKMEELNTFQSKDINLARKCDPLLYNRSYSSVEDNITTAENWFTERITWLEENIDDL